MKTHFNIPTTRVEPVDPAQPYGRMRTLHSYTPVCGHRGFRAGGTTHEADVTCQRCGAYLVRRDARLAQAMAGLKPVIPVVLTPVPVRPDPRRVYVLLYTHQHGVDVSVYRTEDGVWNAVDALKAEYPEDFDAEDPQAWCDVETCWIQEEGDPV